MGNNPDMSPVKREGWILLHMAVSGNNEEMIGYLVKRGADINKHAFLPTKATPLHFAVGKKTEAVIRFLIEEGEG